MYFLVKLVLENQQLQVWSQQNHVYSKLGQSRIFKKQINWSNMKAPSRDFHSKPHRIENREKIILELQHLEHGYQAHFMFPNIVNSPNHSFNPLDLWTISRSCLSFHFARTKQVILLSLTLRV